MGRWIEGDESAKEMLGRVFRERPLLLIPPLHRVPLRVGNVVEIVGPSPSAKTHFLLQASINCILPKEWNGVKCGGLEHMVMFVDLDCRFDALRFAQLLKHRIIEACGSRTSASWKQGETTFLNCELKDSHIEYDKKLFASCMRRFLYIRCYGTSEFLATLKTMHYELQKEKERHGTDIHFLMIDSIGSFYWTDRASASLVAKGSNRRTHSLQIVYETIVQEIRKLMLVHPMLVLATKAASLGNKYPGNEANRQNSFGRILRNQSSYGAYNMSSSAYSLPHREYMPSVWQSFVTHRILLQASDDGSQHKFQPVYLSRWLLPSLNLSDKFTITDAGICII